MSKSASDTNLVLIKPCGGLRVRKLNGQLLDPKGESVVWNAYWRRRELDRDIECVKAEAEMEPAKDEAEAEPESRAKPGRVLSASPSTPQPVAE